MPVLAPRFQAFKPATGSAKAHSAGRAVTCNVTKHAVITGGNTGRSVRGLCLSGSPWTTHVGRAVVLITSSTTGLCPTSDMCSPNRNSNGHCACCVITAPCCTQGLGTETAKSLLQQNYDVTIACRDPARATSAVSKLQSEVPGAVVDWLQMDLADLQSVAKAANTWLDSGKQIDVLLNNAGDAGLQSREGCTGHLL